MTDFKCTQNQQLYERYLKLCLYFPQFGVEGVEIFIV